MPELYKRKKLKIRIGADILRERLNYGSKIECYSEKDSYKTFKVSKERLTKKIVQVEFIKKKKLREHKKEYQRANSSRKRAWHKNFSKRKALGRLKMK